MIVLAAFVLGGWLRFDGLENKPMHADEATGARLLANFLDSGEIGFDPTHFHGPAQSLLAAPLARAFGQSSWEQLEAGTLRLLPALAGTLILLTPFFFRRVFDPSGICSAALLLASSPLLVYYSRMFIHETLFALANLLCIAAAYRYVRSQNILTACFFGLSVGAMAVIRETFAITLIGWACAAAIVLCERGAWLAVRCRWRIYSGHLASAVMVALLCIALFYTDFLRAPAGFFDFFKTFFVYEVTAGHKKPLDYYLSLLLTPEQTLGRWWTEAGVFILALIGYAATWGRLTKKAGFGKEKAALVRCLFYAILVQLLIYSLISYKTPWLMVSVWSQAALAAAFGMQALYCLSRGRALREVTLTLLFVLLIAFQTNQSVGAAHRFHSDERTPYAYVPTSPDVERLSAWLTPISAGESAFREEPAFVVGRQYWPLPWYLRDFERVGYVDQVPPNASRVPLLLIVLTPNAPEFHALTESHEIFYRGLRHEVMVAVLVRKDIWAAYLARISESGEAP